jgi:hypothetical protein
MKAYRKAHADKLRACKKTWEKKNRVHRRACQREWRQNNKDKVEKHRIDFKAKHKLWEAKHETIRRAYKRQWQQRNREHKKQLQQNNKATAKNRSTALNEANASKVNSSTGRGGSALARQVCSPRKRAFPMWWQEDCGETQRMREQREMLSALRTSRQCRQCCRMFAHGPSRVKHELLHLRLRPRAGALEKIENKDTTHATRTTRVLHFPDAGCKIWPAILWSAKLELLVYEAFSYYMRP